jgi:sugar phosphate isomerase/epimerase
VTRREFHGLVLGGLAAVPLATVRAQDKPKSIVAGVRIGAQSYSFRDKSLDATIAAMSAIGLSYCELWSNHVETREVIGAPPEGLSRREATRKWRLEVPLQYFQDIRQKFEAAGITITAYNLSFQNDFTDDEIARGCEMARALGAPVITASSKVSTAAKVDPHAKRSGIVVAFHNHSSTAPDEFATPESFLTALQGRSDKLAINLDIGHFTAAGFDAVEFLDKHHDRIVSLHLKDRKRLIPNPAGGRATGGENLAFGEGETPIIAVLRRLRDRKWDIPAQIEYEYRGQSSDVEVARSYEYCRKALES